MSSGAINKHVLPALYWQSTEQQWVSSSSETGSGLLLPSPLSPPLLSANSRRSLDCSHCSRRPCSTVPLNLVGSDLFWPLQCSGDPWTLRAHPPAWRHTALFSSSLFSPLLLAIHLRCEIFFPSLNWDSSKRVFPINNDTMIRVISAKMAFIIQKLFPLLLSTSSLSTKVGETREERHVHLHSLAAFHSFMETHNKTYNNRWQSSRCPTGGWALPLSLSSHYLDCWSGPSTNIGTVPSGGTCREWNCCRRRNR